MSRNHSIDTHPARAPHATHSRFRRAPRGRCDTAVPSSRPIPGSAAVVVASADRCARCTRLHRQACRGFRHGATRFGVTIQIRRRLPPARRRVSTGQVQQRCRRRLNSVESADPWPGMLCADLKLRLGRANAAGQSMRLTGAVTLAGMVAQDRVMKPQALYHGHRFPAAILSRAVRQWCDKFGLAFACRIKSARGKPGSTWHLDEMAVTLRGEPYMRWGAVDEPRSSAIQARGRDDGRALPDSPRAGHGHAQCRSLQPGHQGVLPAPQNRRKPPETAQGRADRAASASA